MSRASVTSKNLLRGHTLSPCATGERGRGSSKKRTAECKDVGCTPHVYVNTYTISFNVFGFIVEI